MAKTRILLRDLITRLEQSDPNEIYVAVEESEPDVFVIPFEVIPALTKVGGSLHPLTNPAYFWPSGTTMEVDGTFTKTTGDGTGQVDISCAPGDELILMYGQMLVGGVKAGAAPLTVAFRTGTGVLITQQNYIAAAAANNSASIPQVPAGSGAGNVPDLATVFSRLLSGNDILRFTLSTMAFATPEVFILYLRFRSREGLDPVVTPAGGTWA